MNIRYILILTFLSTLASACGDANNPDGNADTDTTDVLDDI